MATLTDWMQKCPLCVELSADLEAANEREGIPLKEYSEFQVHLVNGHLDQLPDYQDDCSNCQEWKWTADKSWHTRPGLLPILRHESQLHRAGHLITLMMKP